MCVVDVSEPSRRNRERERYPLEPRVVFQDVLDLFDAQASALSERAWTIWLEAWSLRSRRSAVAQRGRATRPAEAARGLGDRKAQHAAAEAERYASANPGPPRAGPQRCDAPVASCPRFT